MSKKKDKAKKLKEDEPAMAVGPDKKDIEKTIKDEDTAAKVKEQSKKDRPERGIETMFRTSSSNHQRLSDMADQKAHILITVNSIILSAIISLLLRKLETYGYLIVPSLILVSISLVAMTFAILSTRPSVSRGTFTMEDIEEKKTNLLFFGNFYKMKLADFNYGMQKMMEESDFLYASLIKDLYSQGVVLGKKYHLLRIAYSVFMYGMIASVVAFIFAFLLFSHPADITHMGKP